MSGYETVARQHLCRTCMWHNDWILLVLTVVVVGGCAGGLNGPLSILVALVIGGLSGFLLLPCFSRFHAALDNSRLVRLVDDVEVPEQAQGPRSKNARLLYLDNLKSFLTALVIVHHSTAAFIGIGGFCIGIRDYLHVFQVGSLAGDRT